MKVFVLLKKYYKEKAGHVYWRDEARKLKLELERKQVSK